MKKIVAILWFGVVSCLFCNAGEPATPAPAAGTSIAVQAVGLRVVAPLPAGVKDDNLRPFNWSPGTTVSLMITAPEGGLVLFDHENSVITKFVDGKGGDLLAKPSKNGKDASDQGMSFFGEPGFSRLSTISTDGKACTFEVAGPSIPVKGAGLLKLEGTLCLLCAKVKKEIVLKDLALKKGSKLNVDKTELTISSVGKPDWGDEPLKVSLKAQDSELNEVAEIKFFKADGVEIKSSRVGTSKIGALGALTVEWDYVLSEKVDIATLKLYLWADLQKKKVPLNLSIDAGL